MSVFASGFKALVVCALVGVGLITLTGCPPAPFVFGPGDCAPNAVYPQSPCGSLAAKIANLLPDESINLQPGTYDVGFSLIKHVHGTSAQPITVRAADPAQPPTLKGWLSLWDFQYVTFDHMRFQATWSSTEHGGPAGGIAYMCGVGWKVQNSEFFGADQTLAFWNLLINGKKATTAPNPPDSECPGEPSGFVVSNNVFHNPRIAGCPTTDAPYHHIYANFEGDAGAGGTISRNLFVGNTCGGGIKLGTGSDSRPKGAWNVHIEYNTFYDGARAVVFQNDIRGTVLNRNLTDKIVYPHSINPSISIALGTVAAQTPANTIAHTFAANNLNPNHRVWGPVRNDGIGILTDLCDNVYRATDDPGWNSTDYTVANSFTPSNNNAKPYGRFGTGAFTCP